MAHRSHFSPTPRRRPGLRASAKLMALSGFLVLSAMAQEATFSNAPESLQPYLKRYVQANASSDGGGASKSLEAIDADLRENNGDLFQFYRTLRLYYGDHGNPMKASQVGEKEIAAATSDGQKIPAMASLVSQRAALRDKPGAQAALRLLHAYVAKMNGTKAWRTRGNLWQGMESWATGLMNTRLGYPHEAEAAFRACVDFMTRYSQENPGASDMFNAECAAELAQLEVNQGRLTEAGALLINQRQILEKAATAQQRPSLLSRLAAPTVRLTVEQGRNQEARRIAQEAISAMLGAGAQENSLRLAQLRLELAKIDMLEGRWDAALIQHMARRDGLLSDKDENGQRGVVSVEYGYTLLRLGQRDEAEKMLAGIVSLRQGLFDENSQPVAEANAFYGLALAAQGKREEARRLLAVAVPRLLVLLHGERGSADSGALRTAQLNWVLEGYLSLLSDVALGGGPEAESAIEESFRLADIARGSTVQRALAAAASRSTPANPALAEVARKEQDQENEMAALTDSLNNLLGRGKVAEQEPVVQEMQTQLNRLRLEHEATLKDLQRKFPDYAGLLNPQAAGPNELQKLLKPDEAMVSVYSVQDRTLIWAFGASGPVRFAVAPLGSEAVGAAVTRLRRGLDPNEATLGKISNFDSREAYRLYAALLAPVKSGWAGAEKLILVPHGRLGQLPFGVLLTEPWQETASPLPFSSMINAPWLIRQVAISQLPAALALPVLRQRASNHAENPFIGFGDPLFSTQNEAPAVNGGTQHRNLAIKPSATGKTSSTNMGSEIDFNLLSPLPDTAEEIRQVAQALRADAGRDTFLQQRASEHNARHTDLRNYRVVMFATHGLVPGEMPGLYQPALALSNPALTGEATEPGMDGMLTMEEILTLKLNADWVVLSACNTASSSGKGSEAVSGLGRAFFYAGAKALLVTHWPVETVSARLLTTETFRRQASEPDASRARLLQQAALSVMQQRNGQYSYAHPMFWAPYIIVGDGG